MWAAVIATALLGVGGSLRRSPEVEDERRARRRGWPAPLVVAGLVFLPAAAVAGTAAPPDTGNADSDGLRVVTYNIRQGFGVDGRFDLEAVAQTLEENPADVIALQEVGRGWVISGSADTLTWLSQRLDMPYVYGAGAGDLWGNATLTRLPIRSTVHHFDNPGRIPRGAVEVRDRRPRPDPTPSSTPTWITRSTAARRARRRLGRCSTSGAAGRIRCWRGI